MNSKSQSFITTICNCIVFIYVLVATIYAGVIDPFIILNNIVNFAVLFLSWFYAVSFSF